MAEAGSSVALNGRRTALIIVVPEVEPAVASFRARYASASVTKRTPAHITLLMPYVMADGLDAAAVEAARRHFLSVASFEAELATVGCFTEHVWLAPEPRDAFVELIRATCRRFPESPYGTEFPDPVPHLTVGQVSPGVSLDEIAGAAERELAPLLPVRFRVDAATLLEEQADGSWAARERFPFG